MPSKNPCAKRRKPGNPHEVWISADGWTYQVLKKYKGPESEAKDPYARWHCATQSPFTYGSWEIGDAYAKDIKAHARKAPLDMWLACGLDKL